MVSVLFFGLFASFAAVPACAEDAAKPLFWRRALYPEFGIGLYSDAVGFHAALKGVTEWYGEFAEYLQPYVGTSLSYSYTADTKHVEQDLFALAGTGLYITPFRARGARLSGLIFRAGVDFGGGYTHDEYTGGTTKGVFGFQFEPNFSAEYRMEKMRLLVSPGYRLVFYTTAFKTCFTMTIGGMYVLRDHEKP